MVRSLATAVLITGLGLLLVATALAVRSVGRPFPSLLVDPWADYSAVFLPDWLPQQGMLATERLLTIDGVPVERGGRDFPARALDDAAAKAQPLDLVFDHAGTPHHWTPASRRVQGADVWWLFGLYATLGSLFLWAGWLSWRSGTRGPADLAFAFISVDAFLFLCSFFDYHVTRELSPVFALSSFWLAPSLLLLALAFPRIPAWALRRPARRALGLAFAALFLAGIASAIATVFRLDLRPLRQLLNVTLPLCLLVLGVTMVGRFLSGEATTKRALRPALWGVGALPIFLAVFSLLADFFGVVWMQVVLPLAGLFVPASIGVSVLKTDVFGTSAIVRPSTLVVPVLLVSVAVGGSAGALSQVAWPQVLLVVLGWALGTGALLWFALSRYVFRSRTSFRPVLERLSARLGVHTSSEAIATEVVTLLREALPGRAIEVVTGPAASTVAQLAWQQPLQAQERPVGLLRVAHREDRALLTESDLTLLEVVASITALALANLAARSALEEQHRLESDLNAEDKRLSVDTLAAEVAHELAYPLSYFRHFLTQLHDDHQVPEEDLSIGREEVERLERMLSLVRRFQVGPPHPVDVPLAQALGRAATLLQPRLDELHQTLLLELDPALQVRADRDLLLQLMANLLRNASQAAGEGGRLGVFVEHPRGERLQLVVWDEGPGFSEEVRKKLFSPLFSTRADGSGLGLTICLRIARSLGWSLDAQRRGARTAFVVSGVEPS